jgi:hypothetical protein
MVANFATAGRVLASIFSLGVFLNFQGVPMSIALNSQKHDSSYT